MTKKVLYDGIMLDDSGVMGVHRIECDDKTLTHFRDGKQVAECPIEHAHDYVHSGWIGRNFRQFSRPGDDVKVPQRTIKKNERKRR